MTCYKDGRWMIKHRIDSSFHLILDIVVGKMSESIIDLLTTVFQANLAAAVVFTGGYISAAHLPSSIVSRASQLWAI